MTFLIFLISFLLIMALAWTSSIYYLLLHRKDNEEETRSNHAGPDEDLRFSIIIPCYREEGFILNKLENTASLDYPSDRFNVIVVDGGSEDGTGEIARTFCASQANFSFIISRQRGKIPQVNQALDRITDGIVMITDVDGRLESDALRRLNLLYRDPEIGCAGAYVVPADPLPEDGLFWQHQNAMRLMESRHGHCSVMVAVAYTFRRYLFRQFPDDVIADDRVGVIAVGFLRVEVAHLDADDVLLLDGQFTVVLGGRLDALHQLSHARAVLEFQREQQIGRPPPSTAGG